MTAVRFSKAAHTGSYIKLRSHRAGKPAKVEIRRNVLTAIGPDAHVFDAFAGAGEMHREVWHWAASCTGCDTTWSRDGRLAYVGDNRRVMRSIDLQPFSIFDFDSYGSPWEQVVILAARRAVSPGERIGIVLTEGSALKLKQGGMPNALAALGGFHGKLSGQFRWRDEIMARAIKGLCERMGCEVADRWQAERSGNAAMVYLGLVLVGIKRPAQAAPESAGQEAQARPAA